MEENKDCTGPLVIALQYNDIFDLDSTNTDTEVQPKGVAVSFIKAVQAVNQKLVSFDWLGFEVILVAKECSEDIKVKIVENVKRFDLGIGKFHFCKKEELVYILQSQQVKLFLSTDTDDINKALRTGIPAALLYDRADQHVLDQLKISFSGDVIGFSEDSLDGLTDCGFNESQIETFKTAKICIKEFAAVIGEMRRRFGPNNSPLNTCLVTSWGSRNVCVSALKTLRGWGLDVDEAYCLAGAPCDPILSIVKPHILWDGGLHNLRDMPTLY